MLYLNYKIINNKLKSKGYNKQIETYKNRINWK